MNKFPILDSFGNELWTLQHQQEVSDDCGTKLSTHPHNPQPKRRSVKYCLQFPEIFQIQANLHEQITSVCREWNFTPILSHFCDRVGLAHWILSTSRQYLIRGQINFCSRKKADNLVLSAMFSFPCLARGSLEMRNYIISSIANVIRRYRAAAVDMLQMVNDPTSTQWHVQLCAVQPAGDSYQRSHGGLLTTGGTNDGIGNSLSQALAKLLKPANERLFVETTGRSCQQCPSTSGSSGSRFS